MNSSSAMLYTLRVIGDETLLRTSAFSLYKSAASDSPDRAGGSRWRVRSTGTCRASENTVRTSLLPGVGGGRYRFLVHSMNRSAQVHRHRLSTKPNPPGVKRDTINTAIET